MIGVLEVLNPGLGNGIQDAGRFGYRHMGITVSGCLDRPLARCANTLAGNSTEAACIEARVMGPALKVEQGPVCLAVAGNMAPKVRRADGRQEEAPAWRSVTLDAGDVLETGAVRGGVAYIAVSGGFATPVQLGSRSTYQRALIGGIDGRLLARRFGALRRAGRSPAGRTVCRAVALRRESDPRHPRPAAGTFHCGSAAGIR
jgi:allophanate hydrolase subunit 2